jgi:6-phosphogluconate dehydrogenase (decarboxylating)
MRLPSGGLSPSLPPSPQASKRRPARRDVRKLAALRSTAICIAGPAARGTSSRWSITASAAYAEGLNILHHANIGQQKRDVDAETTPLRHPEHYPYDLNLADIAEVWRRGSVIASWLLDLAAIALLDSPDLAKFAGRVSDSGEGRWTVMAAIDEAVPAPVLSAALYERFGSRGEADFADKLLSALRSEFGGHVEKSAKQIGGGR